MWSSSLGFTSNSLPLISAILSSNVTSSSPDLMSAQPRWIWDSALGQWVQELPRSFFSSPAAPVSAGTNQLFHIPNPNAPPGSFENPYPPGLGPPVPGPPPAVEELRCYSIEESFYPQETPRSQAFHAQSTVPGAWPYTLDSSFQRRHSCNGVNCSFRPQHDRLQGTDSNVATAGHDSHSLGSSTNTEMANKCYFCEKPMEMEQGGVKFCYRCFGEATAEQLRRDEQPRRPSTITRRVRFLE